MSGWTLGKFNVSQLQFSVTWKGNDNSYFARILQDLEMRTKRQILNFWVLEPHPPSGTQLCDPGAGLQTTSPPGWPAPCKALATRDARARLWGWGEKGDSLLMVRSPWTSCPPPSCKHRTEASPPSRGWSSPWDWLCPICRGHIHGAPPKQRHQCSCPSSDGWISAPQLTL